VARKNCAIYCKAASIEGYSRFRTYSSFFYDSKNNTKIMEHGSNLIERIKTDLKDFEFGLIRFYPLNPLFPRSIKVLIGSGLSGLGPLR